jgi:hypothetical protein
MDLERMSLFCGVKIKILPDFLMDHTLLEQDLARRLPELCARWTQFVQRLWAWRGKATFCLRFDSRPSEGSIGVYLLGRPHSPVDRAPLQRDLEFALVAYNILNDTADSDRCLRLLTPAEVRDMALRPETQDLLRQELESEFGKVLDPDLRHCSFVSVTQEVTESLWSNQNVMRDIVVDDRFRIQQPVTSRPEAVPAWVPLSWEGPYGPFLLPFRALMASASPMQVSIYLEPAEVEDRERLWLEKIAHHAHKDPELRDPAAELASSQSARVACRLVNHAFLVAAECVALDGSEDAALSVANCLQALCTDRPGPERENDIGPGARTMVAAANQLEAARTSHLRLQFPRWADIPNMLPMLRRLPYLADARGAATVFRFPVSTRGGVPGVAVEQQPPDFNPGPRGDQKNVRKITRVYRPAAQKSKVLVGRFEAAGNATVDLDDFTKHTLVTGFTGSGKTKTVLHLLHQFWADHHVPFLVIESAKTEYRGLLSVDPYHRDTASNLLIYTLGNESLAPLRLNPFELLPGARVESHVNRLQTCFEAALPPFAPLSSILEQSLIEVYRDLGWMMTDEGVPLSGLGTMRYPTMTEFAAKLEMIGESRGYQGDNKATLLAAIKGRIRPLTRAMHSSKGRMLDTARTNPGPSVLFERPVILELNDLNQEDKALVAMFLLTLLREYREQQRKSNAPSPGGGKLRHITVVEEAHNVLENVQSSGGGEGAGADTRYKAVQAFCAMLAEIRALGEGLIIADQSPEKLAPDAIRNTNLQIAHQLRDARDRDAIANAMIMTEEQREYIGKLKPGYAGVFYTGLERASFVKIPEFDRAEDEFGGRGAAFSEVLPDAEVAAHMELMVKDVKEPDRPFFGCGKCGHRMTCDYRFPVRAAMERKDFKNEFLPAFASNIPSAQERFRILFPVLTSVADAHRAAPDALWCGFVHMRNKWLPYPAGGLFDQGARNVFDQVIVSTGSKPT